MTQVTLKHVADEAGVSTAVASYILRGIERTKYRPATIDRVRETAQRLGYEPNGIARMLRQKTTRLIGVTLNFLATYHHPLVLAVYREVVRREYQPLLIEFASLDSTQSPFANMNCLDGVISIEGYLPEANSTFRDLHQHKPTVVLTPMANEVVDVVTTNRRRLAFLAAEHLAGLGHRRIAYAMSAGGGLRAELKIAGWHDAIERFELDRELSQPLRIGLNESRPDLAGRIAAETVLAMRPRPTAVICDGIAVPTMNELMRRGLRVPQDISVVGHGAGNDGLLSYPQLTTVTVPLQEVAAGAVDRLLERIALGTEGIALQPVHRLLESTLVVRESTAPPKNSKVSPA